MKARKQPKRIFKLNVHAYECEVTQQAVEKVIGMPWDMLEKTYNKDGSVKKIVLPDITK